MANIEKTQVQDAIQESQSLRRGGLTEVLIQYRSLIDSGHEIDASSEEGVQILALSTGGLNAQELLRATQVLRAGVTRRISALREDVERNSGVQDIREMINAKIAILNIDSRNTGVEGRVLDTLSRVQDVFTTQGITPETIMKYEIYIAIKRYGLIDNSTGLIEVPESEGELGRHGKTPIQAIFDSLPDNRLLWDAWDPESWVTSISKLPMFEDYTPYEEGLNTAAEEGVEATIYETESFMMLVYELTQLDEYDNTTIPLLNKIDGALIEFQSALPYLEDIENQEVNHAITPELVAGQKSTWTGSPFDRLEDFLSRNSYNNIGEKAEEIIELADTPDSNFDTRVINGIARIGLGVHFEASSQFEARNINSFFSEMREGVDGIDVNNITEEEFQEMFLPFHQMNIWSIAEPLQEELRTLQSWEAGDTWDPWMRVGKGINADGDIIGYQNYGPYNSPKEKAIAISTYLLMLDGLEKDGRLLISYIYDNWLTNLPDYIFGFEGVTLLQLYVTERYLSTMFRITNGVRGLRPNTGSSIGRLLSRVPFLGSGETQEQQEQRDRRIERRKSEVETLQSILNDLGITDERVDQLGDFLDEDARGFMNHSTMFSKQLFYSDLFGIINDKSYGMLSITRSRAHYRLMEMFNVNIQSSLGVGDPNGIVPFSGDFENRQLFGRNIPGTGNRVLGRRVDGTGMNMPHLDPREIYRFRHDGIWRESPLAYHNISVSPQRKIRDIIERYEMVNQIFGDLKDFEKYRPDVADDSSLDSKVAEVEEMRKQFLQGNVVELNSSGDVVRDADGKLQFVPNTENPEGNRPDDFKKFVKDWMKTGDPDFDLDYGKVLKADAISDTERTEGRLIEDLEKAKTFAGSRPTEEKQTMERRISILEDRLTETSGEVPEGGDRAPYSDHMTKTEFYQRLAKIMNNDGSFEDALDINNKSEFESAKVEVDNALRGNSPNHVLTNIFNTAAVAEQTARVEESRFNPRNLDDIGTREGIMLQKAELYAIAQGDENLLQELSEVRSRTRRIRTMNGFYRILTNDLGIPQSVDFERRIDSFRSDAMRNVVKIGGNHYYIEGLNPGEAGDIQSRVEGILAQQRADKTRTTPVEGEGTIIRQAIDDLNIGDGGTRQMSTRQIFIDTLRRVFR